VLIRILPLTLLWVIIFALTLLLNSPSALLTRIRKGESVATITREADPKNHQYLTYQYTVDGRTFSGAGYGPNHTEMGVGEQVRIVYFPARPQYATIATDQEQTKDLELGLMAGIVMATAGTLGAYLRYFRGAHRRQ
jgi:hypothetical protein